MSDSRYQELTFGPDNAATLFLLSCGPNFARLAEFRVNTVKALGDVGKSGGRVYAAIFTQQGTLLSLFIQGPLASSSVGALRALLDKTEDMIGRRWGETMDERYFLDE